MRSRYPDEVRPFSWKHCAIAGGALTKMANGLKNRDDTGFPFV